MDNYRETLSNVISAMPQKLVSGAALDFPTRDSTHCLCSAHWCHTTNSKSSIKFSQLKKVEQAIRMQISPVDACVVKQQHKSGTTQRFYSLGTCSFLTCIEIYVDILYFGIVASLIIHLMARTPKRELIQRQV